MKKLRKLQSREEQGREGNRPMFDDALPEQFVDVVPKKGERSLLVKIDEPVEPSPFIVKLTSPDHKTGDPIAALRQSLVYEFDDEAAEAPLVEMEERDDALTFALREQLLEEDRQGERIVPVPNIQTPSENEHASLPVLAVDVEPADIISLLVEDAVEEAPGMQVAREEEIPRPRRVRRTLTVGWSRALASFVAVAIVLVLPLQALQVLANTRKTGEEISGQSKAALETFLRGATSLSEQRFSSATEDFSKAADEFKNAEASLGDLHTAVVAVVNVLPQTEKTVSSVRGLVTAGQELSETAELLSLAAGDITPQKSTDLVTKIGLLSTYLEEAEPHVVAANSALRDVDPAIIPAEYQDKVKELKTRVPQLAEAFHEYLVFTDALTVMLGGKEKVRYLAAFQNNTELRPTGGFVGSFAEMDVKGGEIERLSIPGGGSYATQGQLSEYVAAPGPLQLLRARWEFQDANWFPDFPASAEKMLWFQEKSGGPTMDGVIAVNATFVQELLGILGPVEMEKYGRTITAENFLLETQKIVELEYDQSQNTPKAFIGDLAPVLLERITKSDFSTLLSVLSLIGKGLEEKDIMVYFSNNDLELAMERLGWTGSMKKTNGDYLMVVDTNLGGGKTDTVIDQNVDVTVDVASDGTVENTVKITKTHRGMKNALFNGVNNVDYLRLYVPEGATLLAADGFEIPADNLFDVSDVPLSIDEDLALHMKGIERDAATGTDIWTENGKTVFGNWMQTAPGETETVTFTYRLPFTLDLTDKKTFFEQGAMTAYSLFVQKQPGVLSRATTVTVHLPKTMDVLWSSPLGGKDMTAAFANSEDAFVAWLLEP